MRFLEICSLVFLIKILIYTLLHVFIKYHAKLKHSHLLIVYIKLLYFIICDIYHIRFYSVFIAELCGYKCAHILATLTVNNPFIN